MAKKGGKKKKGKVEYLTTPEALAPFGVSLRDLVATPLGVQVRRGEAQWAHPHPREFERPPATRAPRVEAAPPHDGGFYPTCPPSRAPTIASPRRSAPSWEFETAHCGCSGLAG